MLLRRLALANFSTHRTRAALTTAAIALSVSLVVAVTSGYISAEAAAFKYLAQFMGTVDAQITRQHDIRGNIPQHVVAELAADPDVQLVTGRLEMESGLIDKSGKPIIGPAAQIVGIARPEDRRVDSMQIEAGRWFERSDVDEAVIDQVAQEKLGVKTGETFELPSVDGRLRLTVVGVVRKPGILAQAMQTIYVPLETLQKFVFPDNPMQVSRILIDLRQGTDEQAFAARWKQRLAAADPLLKFRLASENRREMDRNLRGLHVLSYLGGTVSMLAAAFIVFSALSMGVAEQQRSLAMLRAIGAYRRQLAQLVTLEGLAVAIAGVLIGVPLGILWLYLLTHQFPEQFLAGAVISWGGILFAAVGSTLAALAACALPAWAAMRVDPLEAMNPLAVAPRRGVPILPTLLGLVLISFDPLILFVPWATLLDSEFSRAIVFYLHFIVGLPTLMVGFFLLAPIFIWITERVIGPIVAWIFGLRFEVLRQQLSGGIWRAAGTCAALMVGLSILIVMQTQGRTALSGWRLPDRFPDIFIAGYKPGGFKADDQKKIESVKGIKRGEVMPILIAAPGLIKEFFAIKGAEVMPDATMFFGVDPDKALSMMELEFRLDDGSPAPRDQQPLLREQAREMLKKGRHVIVTDEFRALRGLKTGDKLILKTPKHGAVEYTVAGVVWSPGIDVIVSMFDMGRQFDQRTAASVFGSIADARNDFGIEGAYLFAANLEYHVDKDALVEDVKTQLGAWGMKAGDIRKIKFEIQQGFERLLLLTSTIAFAAMAVASLGVVNTIMASIRSRRWQFGILRSIGFTRGALLRLVVAEAVLLGMVGCALGLAAGFEMAINARREWTMALGYSPPMDVPWPIVLIGTAVVMGISILASLIPAVTVARSEPLELLQAGRATA